MILLFSGAGMLALIFDSKTALLGAAEGIELCLKTVIPSLFPFFVLSILLTGTLLGACIPLLYPIGKRCGIPRGAESILLVGLLGGYPVGAQCIAQACASGQLSRRDARRMLGFCNNAGPAFLFGILGSLFSSHSTVFILWGIHILSALITGALLPGLRHGQAAITPGESVNISQALHRSIRVLASVCGWIVLFRVILAFLQRWCLWLLPKPWQVAFFGILELANGCLMLNSIQSESLRFILAAGFLGFGGVCVWMQTVSILSQAGLDGGFYFHGKLLQCTLSIVFASTLSPVLFPDAGMSSLQLTALIAVPIILVLLYFVKIRKNYSSIPSEAGV